MLLANIKINHQNSVIKRNQSIKQ